MTRVPAVVRWSWFACGLLAVVVWNGIFDLLVTRGEKYYMWQQAQATVAGAPRVSLDTIMTQTIHDAIVVASLWAALVALVSGAAVTLVWRRVSASPRP